MGGGYVYVYKHSQFTYPRNHDGGPASTSLHGLPELFAPVSLSSTTLKPSRPKVLTLKPEKLLKLNAPAQKVLEPFFFIKSPINNTKSRTIQHPYLLVARNFGSGVWLHWSGGSDSIEKMPSKGLGVLVLFGGVLGFGKGVGCLGVGLWAKGLSKCRVVGKRTFKM